MKDIARIPLIRWRAAIRDGWHAKGLILLFAVSFLLALAPLTPYRKTLANTFMTNHSWMVFKDKLPLVITGVKEYEEGGQALAGNRLNLGAWHGFQEVLYRDKIVPVEADFSFLLKKGAHVTFVFDRSWEGWRGLRFSNHPKIASGYLKTDAEGKFLEKIAFQPEGFAEDHWHRCRIRFDAGTVTAAVDGAEVYRGSVSPGKPNWAGFKGSGAQGYVDDVRLSDTQGTVFKENFSPRSSGSFRYLEKIACLAAAAYLVLLLTATGLGLSLRTSLGWACSLNLTLALCGAMVYLFQLHIMAERYPLYDEKLKGLERLNAHKALVMVQDEISKTYAKETPENTLRILFVGGSQTWGEGANQREDTFVSRIETRLNERAVAGKRYQCIDGGIRGGTSIELFEGIKGWLDLNPALVVMDLGCNDGILTEKDIRENAGGMMDLCRKKDIPIVLAIEALSLECVPEPLWSFNVLRFLADERHLMQIDLYESLNRRIDTGCLFWDQVHPTSYGHRLIADELYPKIVAQLCALVEKQRYESETPIQKVQK